MEKENMKNIYDEHDDFSFPIVNFPFIYGIGWFGIFTS